MTYPDRWEQAVAQGEQLDIYVPVKPGLVGIAPGSAIVGRPNEADRVLVHYEGWVHGAAQYADLDTHGRWAAGVRHAAGRALTQYPTVACAVLPVSELVPVGTYYAAGDRIEVTNEAEVARWLM